MTNRETVRVALPGAGERGPLTFGLFARDFPRLADAVIDAMPDVHPYPSTLEALRRGFRPVRAARHAA